MAFQPGQSGNPNGRPPKNRALTEILQKAGDVTVEVGGDKRTARKRLLARLLWEFATTGVVRFSDGENDLLIVADVAEWLGAVKFLYQHIDGGAQAEIDITSNGRALGPGVFLPAVRDEDNEIADGG